MADPTDHNDSDAPATDLADLSPEEGRLFERFAAILAAAGPPALSVLRVERLEVVDRQGRASVVIGELGAETDTVGIGVYDRRHSERVTLAMSRSGPWLSFALEGDDALVLGVDDPETEALHPGPYLALLGAEGGVACGWRVDRESGIVEAEGVQAVGRRRGRGEPEA